MQRPAHLGLGIPRRHEVRERGRAVSVTEDEAARDLAGDVLQRPRGRGRHGQVRAPQQPHELRDAVAPAPGLRPEAARGTRCAGVLQSDALVHNAM